MRNVLTSNGYTLVDAIIQLAVLMLFSQLMLFYSVWFNQVEKHFLLSEAIEWEMFSLDMESYLSSVEAIEEQQYPSGIRIVKDGEEYDIECSSSLIRKQKFQLGNEAMLTGLKLCKLEVVRNQVTVRVTFENGRNEERAYEVFISSQ